MIDQGKRNVLGVLVDAIDYQAATEKVLAAARERRPLALTALIGRASCRERVFAVV